MSDFIDSLVQSRKNGDYMYQQGVTDTINKCAEIMSKISDMCGRNCPIDCYFGTEESCVESWKVYLEKQVRGGENE